MHIGTLKMRRGLAALPALLVASSAHAQVSAPVGTEPSVAKPAEQTTTPSTQDQVSPPPVEQVKPAPAPTWYAHPPYEFSVGPEAAKWKATIYGFVEFDVMNDSTRSWTESQANNLIVRNETYSSQKGRTQFTLRDSRLGVKLMAPLFEGIKTTGLLEFDFFANPGAYSGNTLAPTNITETAYYNNGVFRLRHGWVKFETEYVNILGGQTYNVFGGQPYFFPCAADYLPLPNEAYGRVAQLRLSKTFQGDAVSVQVDVAAMRPPQRDSMVPQGEAAVRVLFPGWKAIHTPGGGGTAADPAAIGVSGLARRFEVNQFRGTMGTPTGSSTDTGWAVAVDAMLPIISVKSSEDRGNALTVVGEFTTGSGYADMLLGNPGGLGFPNAPGTSTPFAANIDNGMVTYDPSGNGVLHTLDFRTYLAGIQYYLPPSGRFSVSANYSHGESKNIVDLVGGPTSSRATSVIKDSNFYDGNLFFDITPAARTGVAYHMTTQTYGDGQAVHSMRWFATLLYFF